MATYWEFDHSPTEQYGEDGTFVAKRRLGCAWADRYTVLSYFASGTGSVYPYNNLSAYAIGATIIPFNDEPNSNGGDTTQMSYATAVVTITYAIAPYYPRAIGGRLMTEELHPWIEYRTLPKDKLHVGSAGGSNPEQNARVIVPGLDYILTSYDHAVVSSNALNLMGKVNQAPWIMYMLGFTVAAQHMLYVGPAPQISSRLGLSPSLAISQMFKIRGQPWSKEWTENGWEWIYNDAGSLIYTEGDFSWCRPSWIGAA